jgi:hypothetical protein
VEGARIDLGENESFTDEDGVVYLQDVTMGKSTYVTAERTGFFHGSRVFYPSAGKVHFVKIIMLSDQAVGTFSG